MNNQEKNIQIKLKNRTAARARKKGGEKKNRKQMKQKMGKTNQHKIKREKPNKSKIKSFNWTPPSTKELANKSWKENQIRLICKKENVFPIDPK